MAEKMSPGYSKLLTACLAALSSVAMANNNGRDNHWGTRSARAILAATEDSIGPILETKGGITRHLSISRPREFKTVWTWLLNPDGSLSWKDLGSNAGWQTYENLTFISAPEVLNIWSSSQDLRVVFAIQSGTGHLLYTSHYVGKWDTEWHDLGGRFTYRPASVSGTTSLNGVFGVNEKGELLYSALRHAYTPLEWSEWALMGTGFTGEVAAASATPGMWEIAGLVNGTYRHGRTDYQGSPPVWTDLGRPPNSIELGWPKIVALPDTRPSEYERATVDVLVVADGVVWHKYYDGTSWSEEWIRLPPSHDGLEIVNSQEVLIAYPDNGYLFSRGSDNCVYQTQFSWSSYNYTTGETYRDWYKWNSLWCPTDNDTTSTNTQRSPLSIAAIALDDNRFDFVIETPSGTLEHARVYQEDGTFDTVVPNWVAIEGKP